MVTWGDVPRDRSLKVSRMRRGGEGEGNRSAERYRESRVEGGMGVGEGGYQRVPN